MLNLFEGMELNADFIGTYLTYITLLAFMGMVFDWIKGVK